MENLKPKIKRHHYSNEYSRIELNEHTLTDILRRKIPEPSLPQGLSLSDYMHLLAPIGLVTSVIFSGNIGLIWIYLMIAGAALLFGGIAVYLLMKWRNQKLAVKSYYNKEHLMNDIIEDIYKSTSTPSTLPLLKKSLAEMEVNQ